MYIYIVVLQVVPPNDRSDMIPKQYTSLSFQPGKNSLNLIIYFQKL